MRKSSVRVALSCLVAVAAALAFFGCSSGSLESLLGEGVFTLPPKVAVVTNWDDATIASYKVDANTGAVTEVASSPVASQTPDPWGITLHPNGKWVYVASDANTNVEIWSVNNSTGDIASMGVVNTTRFVDWVTGIAITQDGKWVYTADCNQNISIFAVNQTSGMLSPAAGNPLNIPAVGTNCLNSIAVVNSKFVYANDFTGNVYGFTINSSTGALTPIAGLPADLAGGETGNTLSADLTGQFLYIGTDEGNIYAARIDQTTGALTAISTGFPVALDSGNVYQMSFDPRNKFMYVANNSGAVEGFAFNSSTGALTVIPGSPFAAGTNPQGVTVDPSGKFVYATNWPTSNDMSGYSINQSTGALTPLAGSPFPNVGCCENSLVVTH